MRNVLVTGASRGLGLAIAERLAADGFRVLAVARKPSDPLSQAMADAEGGSGAIVFEPYDLMQTDGLADFARRLKDIHGPCYGLVNNAGVGTDGLLVALSVKQIEDLVRLNTLSPILLTRSVLRQMLAAGEGRVVNISSIVASTGFNGLSAYGATKASLIGFTRSLAREVGRAQVTVNAVAPGFIATELTAGMDAEGLGKIAGRAALRRLADPSDVAGAVAYLMSEDGRNVTGTVITVDAGNTA